MTKTRVFSLAFAALVLAACGGGEPATETAQPPAAPAPQAPADAPAATYDGPPAEITITPVGNEMRYEQTEFTVAPGQTVHLTLNNTATNPAMSHNVVVLALGADPNAVGQAALSAAGTGYIPQDMADRIVAHTPMSAPGQTVEVTFTAPQQAGDYPYICTFPGHYVTMRGTMRVAQAPA